jgi:hypothetical protein
LDDLPRFTQLNNISFMVLAFKKNNFYPVYFCEEMKAQHVDLILLKAEEKDECIYHFIASNNTPALLRKPGTIRLDLCTYCLRQTSELKDHQQKCGILHRQVTTFPNYEQ